jgi:hypothetical protein
MRGGQHENPGLLADLPQAEPWRGDRRADEGDVGAAVQQAGRGLGQLEAAQPDLDLGLRLTEDSQQRARRLTGGGDAEPHGQPPANRPGGVASRAPTAVERGEGFASSIEEGAASRRDRHTPAGARK